MCLFPHSECDSGLRQTRGTATNCDKRVLPQRPRYRSGGRPAFLRDGQANFMMISSSSPTPTPVQGLVSEGSTTVLAKPGLRGSVWPLLSTISRLIRGRPPTARGPIFPNSTIDGIADALRACRSEKDFHKLHRWAESILTPLETAALIEFSHHLPSQSQDWLNRIAALGDFAIRAPQPYCRQPIARTLIFIAILSCRASGRASLSASAAPLRN